MSKNNYSQYYGNNNKKKHSNKPKVDESSISVSYKEEVAPAPVEPVVEVAVAAPEIKMEPAKVVTGVVSDCVKLNVRVAPFVSAEVATILDAKSVVEIDMSKSTAEWFSVLTAAGVEGYCMRKFVSVQR